MGHLVGKDVYRNLGKKIDSLTCRAPWNNTLYKILKELYTSEEAEFIVKMPYSLSNLSQIVQATGFKEMDVQRLLDSLCSKGLILDIWIKNKFHYIISPMVVGIFEFTMMRTRGELNLKEWARLFHDYLNDSDGFFKANFGNNQKISPLRALPHEGTVGQSEYVEILDYEKASSIIDENNKFAIGICSCRHEKLHVGEKSCDNPLETCSSFGISAEIMIRNNLAKEVSKTEMLENLARSKEAGMVFCADNVKKDVSFICHCCGCCCNVLLGITRMGYTNVLVTSNYIAKIDREECLECGTCVDSCPINAIESKDDGAPEIDESICIGCGVCTLNCSSESLRLTKRLQRVLHPEDTFERIILQCLERGTLQNQMFGEPTKVSHKFMRGFVGGFLRLPPVKKALMSDSLRSSFLDFIKKGAAP